MDVDGAARELATGPIRENLHVTRQHQQISIPIPEQHQELLLLLLFAPRLDRQVVKWQSVPLDETPLRLMIGHDFSAPLTILICKHHAGARASGLDRRPKSGCAAADHQHVVADVQSRSTPCGLPASVSARRVAGQVEKRILLHPPAA